MSLFEFPQANMVHGGIVNVSAVPFRICPERAFPRIRIVYCLTAGELAKRFEVLEWPEVRGLPAAAVPAFQERGSSFQNIFDKSFDKAFEQFAEVSLKAAVRRLLGLAFRQDVSPAPISKRKWLANVGEYFVGRVLNAIAGFAPNSACQISKLDVEVLRGWVVDCRDGVFKEQRQRQMCCGDTRPKFSLKS